MITQLARCVNAAFAVAEAGLTRLQRRCPKCGGDLRRRFSLLDKIALYVPLPHTVRAQHECEECHARFRTFRPLTDFYLEASWSAATWCMGDLWLIALACPISWVVTSWWFKREAGGNVDTTAAGAMTAVLWVLALVFGNLERGGRLLQHPVGLVLLTAVLLFLSTGIALFLDRYTAFNLREVGNERR